MYKEELFICKLKKIVETVNLKTPFYVSIAAGNTLILYRKAILNPVRYHSIKWTCRKCL